MDLILAIECDPSVDIICTPEFVNELFETHTVFTLFGFGVTRSILLMFLAAFIVIGLLYFAFRKPRVVPTKFGAAVEAIVGFVRDEIAIGVIGPEGIKYFPYLLSIFMFILVGNLFEVMPLVNFPITSRMAVPALLSVLTYLIFVVVGFAKSGPRYFLDIVWPKSVPIGLRWLVGLIELISVFVLRPLTLAVRLFANFVAGHTMLSILITSGVVFLSFTGGDPEPWQQWASLGVVAALIAVYIVAKKQQAKMIGLSALLLALIAFVYYASLHSMRPAIGLGWAAFGMGIFVFEIAVAVLQAYIFTLLAAVYIQTSVHPEH